MLTCSISPIDLRLVAQPNPGACGLGQDTARWPRTACPFDGSCCGNVSAIPGAGAESGVLERLVTAFGLLEIALLSGIGCTSKASCFRSLIGGQTMSTIIVKATATGEVLYCDEGLSFWGGVDPETGVVIDVHHPWHGRSIAGKVLVMPTSRGSCSGSGVLLQLALNNLAPAALVFCKSESVLTLGAIIAARIFDKKIAVVYLARHAFEALSAAFEVDIDGLLMRAGAMQVGLHPLDPAALDLTCSDLSILAKDATDPMAIAMDIICAMAVALGASCLTDVSRGHIDGCILAHQANLIFAERMAELGAKVVIPTTINAISIDLHQADPYATASPFGNAARRLAEAYVTMGARPTFTCAPYFLEDVPQLGEKIGWSESNAVIFANSVLGAQTAKLPDYLDLFVAMTGRAPATEMYVEQSRRPTLILECQVPVDCDDSLWPMIGWIAGRMSPDDVPLLTGLDHLRPATDDLRALCAAFGTTSASPMLHVAGITPEAHLDASPGAPVATIELAQIRDAWQAFNAGPEQVDLIAIGSPHASLSEVTRFYKVLNGRSRHRDTNVILTVGRDVLAEIRVTGLLAELAACGVKVITDLCWCSITEPLIPPDTRNLMTNSGKYAHYAPGLCGRTVRFGSLRDCAEAAVSGRAINSLPDWLSAG